MFGTWKTISGVCTVFSAMNTQASIYWKLASCVIQFNALSLKLDQHHFNAVGVDMMLYWIHKINVNYLKQKRFLDSENKTFNCFCLWPSRPMINFMNRSTRLCGRSAALYSRFTLIIVDTESSACLGHWWGVCFLQFLQNQHPSLKVSL